MKAVKELDVLIAEKVMEWPEFDRPMRATFPHFVNDGLDFVIFRSASTAAESWSPSTEIAAAFEVVEKMRSLGWVGWIQFRKEYDVSFRMEEPQSMRAIHQSTGKSESAPHAICLAALDALEKK